MTTVFATIFVLGVLIFFHELGHFILAKWAGIKVEKFSLGFPPTLISKKWGETVYTIGMIPLGGYVKMAGDNPHEDTEGKPWEFMSKPVWKRFLVVFAGPFMNFILAVVVLTGLYMTRGIEAESIYVGNVIPGSPAAMAGISTGDNIISLDGIKTNSYYHLSELLKEKIDVPVEISWLRNGKEHNNTIVTTGEIVLNADGDSVEAGTIGIGGLVLVGEVVPDMPAAEIGLLQGDAIVAIDGIMVKSFKHMAGLIHKKLEEPVEITWRRDGKLNQSTVITQLDTIIYNEEDTVEIGLIGIGSMAVYEKLNAMASLSAGFNRSVFYVTQVFKFVWDLMSRQVKASEIGGPIFIGQLAGATARAGIDVLLEFLALLSINLAVLNVLPIPILDGGHIMFLLLEKIKGSPPSIKTRRVAQQIGIAFMLILVIFVTFNDITR